MLDAAAMMQVVVGLGEMTGAADVVCVDVEVAGSPYEAGTEGELLCALSDEVSVVEIPELVAPKLGDAMVAGDAVKICVVADADELAD